MTATEEIILALLFLATPAQNFFAIRYGFFSPWWTTAIGRALMTKSTGLALVLDLAVIGLVAPEWWLRDPLRIIIYCILVIGIYYQLIVLWRIQKSSSEAEAGEASMRSTREQRE